MLELVNKHTKQPSNGVTSLVLINFIIYCIFTLNLRVRKLCAFTNVLYYI